MEPVLMMPDAQQAQKRKKIFFVLPSMAGGGAERVACVLLQHLNREAWDPALVLCHKTGECLRDVPSDVAIVDLGKRTRWDAGRLLLRLRRLLKTEQPAVVLSMLHYANILTVFAALGLGARCRIIVSEHNYHRRYLPSTRLSGLRKRLMVFAYQRADQVIAVSRGIKEILVSDFSLAPDHVEMVYNPIDFRRIQELSREDLAHPFFMNDRKEFVLLAAGRLIRQKNFALLLRALKLVRQKIPASLIILGQGELEVELKALAQELGLDQVVSFAGFQSNPYAWMKRADAFVLSSSWEGFALVLLEAMACGLPVIATNCPSGPSEIIDHRVNGLLVPMGDAVAMSRAIIELAEHRHLREAMASRALATIERFHVPRVITEYERVFRSSNGVRPCA